MLQLSLAGSLTTSLLTEQNALIVGTVAEVLILSTMSDVLRLGGERPLDERWTLTPVGGLQRAATFVALSVLPSRANIAALLDRRPADSEWLGRVQGQTLLPVRVLTYGDFTRTDEATIEDMFEPSAYLEFVNAVYEKELAKPLTLQEVTGKGGIVSRVAKYMEERLAVPVAFSRYRPARYFTDRVSSLRPKLTYPTLDRFRATFEKLNGLLP
jgi:hypothetical protein